jgi:AraC-like DNA-binding protein
VYTVPSDTNHVTVTQLKQVLDGFPGRFCIALFFTGKSSPVALMELSSIAPPEVAAVDTLNQSLPIRFALERCSSDLTARMLLEQLDLPHRDGFATVLIRALRLAHQPFTVPDLANSCGLPERSLREYCMQHAMLGPQWIVGWARIIVACHYLAESWRTVESIAELLQYPSAVALRNQLRRYTGFRPTELRERGSVQTASEAFKAALLEAEQAILRQRGDRVRQLPHA